MIASKVDVQEQYDTRGISLSRAGIKGFRLPIKIRTKEGYQHVTATVNAYASLASTKRGVHLSRLVETVLGLMDEPVSPQLLRTLTANAQSDLSDIVIECSFFYFLEKISPVSKSKSPLDYLCKLIAEIKNNTFVLTTEVNVPITTLCPDSKELSRYGAHNQRSFATIQARGDVWFEELIHYAEESGSCDVYQILHKMDDKFVTEKAYENPKFVEDVVRDIAAVLKNDKRISWFRVFSEDHESNHNYNAYAETQMEKV